MDLTNTARICPVGLYMPTIPLPASNYRNQLNDIYSAEPYVRPPKVNICNPFLRGHSTTLGVGCGFLYFRSKTVLGLPVLTTSYFRHVVRTIQTWSAQPTTVRSSIDTGGGYIPFLSYPDPTHLRPISISLYSTTHFKAIAKESRS